MRKFNKKDLVLLIDDSRLALIESCIVYGDGTYHYSVLFDNGTIGAWYSEWELILKTKEQYDLYDNWKQKLPPILREDSE